MEKRWSMVSMPLTSAIYIDQFIMLNSQYQIFDSQILMHSCTQKNDISLAKQSQKHLSKEHRKYVFIDHRKTGKDPVKENGQTESIMFRMLFMFHTKM